jgi:tetratricopeptide (TPR) repeat protein
MVLGMLVLQSAWAESEVLHRVDSLFENRHLDPGNLEQCRCELDSLMQIDSCNSEVLWRLGRYYYEIGSDLEVKQDRLDRLSRARSLLERSIALHEGSAAAHFFLGATLGRYGQTRGKMKSLFLVKPIKRAFTRSLELDGEYVRAMSGLGSLYDELPGVAGGDQGNAVAYFRQAIQTDSNYSYAYVSLAEILLDKKLTGDARDLLQQVVEMKTPTYPADYYLEDRPRAQSLIDGLDRD